MTGMRTLFHLAWILPLGLAAGGAYYLHAQSASLRAYCTELPLGATLGQARESARARGLSAELEAYAEIRVRAPHGLPSRPACRVFLGPERTVSYRVWQDHESQP